QQIEIEMIDAEAREARLASMGDAISGDVFGLHLGNQIYAITLAGDDMTEEFLGQAISVVARRIDQRHTEKNARTHRLCFNSVRVPALSEMPGALTERGDGGAVRELYGSRRGLRRCPCGSGKTSSRPKRCTQGRQRQPERRATRAELTPAEQMLVHSVPPLFA